MEVLGSRAPAAPSGTSSPLGLKVLDREEETSEKLSRPSSPITSSSNLSPLRPATEVPSVPNEPCPTQAPCGSPRLAGQSPSQTGLKNSASPALADRPAMGHPSCAPESFSRQVTTPSQSAYSSTENPPEVNDLSDASGAQLPLANERVPRPDSYGSGFRKHELSSSREDFYQGSNVSEKDRAPIHSSIQSSMSASYAAQESQPYSHYDSHPSSDLRHYHQNSPNPANPMNQQYLQQNSSMQHSPSTTNNPSEQSLSSSSSLLQKHRHSPFMHRDSPLSNESSQHLHPHGSPHLHHDSPHYHHHQNSPHLPLNPLSYPGGRSIDSPHNHSSPLRKEPGSQDGRYPLDFNPGHHRPPPHGMQQSPSPHRPYNEGLQMKGSPHHGLHDPQQEYIQQQAIKSQHQGGHDGYWNMHMDSLSNKLKAAGGGNKDWFDSSGGADSLMSERTSSHKSDSSHYQGYQSNSQMPPHHPMAGADAPGHDGSPLHTGQQQHLSSACHGYSPQQPQAGAGSDQSMQGSQQPHYPNYPGMGGNMSPMSPGYQSSTRNPPPPHQQQQYHGGQYPGDPQQYGQMPMPQQPYSGQGCHLGPQGMGPHGPGGREGDPYSFVDEYTGPSPRPVDEVLGTQQPKRRGRKPKHIKLMENGGDPLAIAAALAAHEAKKRKKKIMDPEAEMIPNNLNDPLLVAAAQAAHEAKKRKMKPVGPDGKAVSAIIKPRKKLDRFDGLPEDEVAKRVLPDHLGPNLDIVIIGINPGLFAAYKGHHYAGPGNHFWKCLFLSGLIPEPLTCDDDHQLLHHGIGFTNIVARTTRGSAELTRKEIKEGGQHLLSKLQQYQPRIAVFNGKGIYEIFSGKKEFSFGRQPEKIEGTHTHVWVMPSSSARCAQLPRALDKVPFYTALRKFRDFLKGTLDELKEEDIAFANVKIRNLKKDPEKMAALAGDSILKGEAIVEDFMGNDMLRGHEMMGDEIHKSLMGSDVHKPMDGAMHDDMMGREKMVKSEILGDMPTDGRINNDGMNNTEMNLEMDPMRREAMGGGSGGEDSMRRDMMGEEGRRDMIFSGNENISSMLGEDSIKLEMNDISVKEELEEDEEVSKITPQSLFKLNGMSREQLESLDCPTIPIRKKRGRPKKTPDDPNMPDRPRQRSLSQQQQLGGLGPPGSLGPPGAMMCNGLGSPMLDEIPRKKRGRPKKLLPDGTVPPPKRPGRKPKALKEMLQQQPPPSHCPPMGHMGGMPLHDSPHHMAMNHMNGIMSPQGFSPNHNNHTFSPQYGGSGQPSVMGQHVGPGMHGQQQQYMHSQMGAMHQGSGLTPTHPGAGAMNHSAHNGPLTPGSNNAGLHPSIHPHNPSGNPSGGGRGNTPHQFGQSPGYSPNPITPQHHLPPHYPNHVPQHQEMVKNEMPAMEEDHHLGLSPPPASPVMAQPDFDPPTSMPENDPPQNMSSASDTRPANLTPNHPSPAPSHMDTSQPLHSNPSTPMDHSNPSSYPQFPSSYPPAPTPHHSPAKHGNSPMSLGALGKNDVASKSLSGLESLVDQIPSISGDHHETSSQHSTHSSTHSATQSNVCSNPTTPAPSAATSSHPPFSPGPPPYNNSSSSYSNQAIPTQPPVSHYNSPQHPYSPHYSSPQQQAPYSPLYSSNSTNVGSTNFSVSSLANSSHSTSLSYSHSSVAPTQSSTPATSPSSAPSTSSFSVSSLTAGSPTPAPSLYSSSSYSPVPPGPSLSHSSYPDIMGSPMLAPTPPMGSSFMGSPGLMGSASSMPSMSASGSMGAMGSLHSQMSASQIPYPYSQFGDSGPPHYPSPASHASFSHYPSSAPPGFHVPSPRFPYPSPYSNSPYSQGYSQNAMLERIKHSGMGMGFGSF